ncbi:MAG: tetratricopeptide repeat protein [Planctomycetota bacterium]|jgi:tetratricopeptide (TPR) repeat protein
MGPPREKLYTIIICVALVLATASIYWQVQGHEFVNLDDYHYVSDNQQVHNGLTREGLIWAFTTTHMFNWHPLTWLSLMLDCELFEAKSRACHITNMLFHIANTLLLFWVLNRMTQAAWRSAFVAALFALHPLHVESVAWVSERKDVLSTFFWLLTMWAYLRYTERTELKRYVLVLLFFILGLMAKPMVVTLPFVLLLLDYWPLGRLRLQELDEVQMKAGSLLLEKIPFFVCTAVSCVVTYVAQQRGGAVGPIAPLLRISNILVSYLIYIQKMIWPSRLAVFYPYARVTALAGQAVGGALLLLAVSIEVIRRARSEKYLVVGWLWYLGTLVPVIGLVQAGTQAWADRYTYIPLIGLFIMITWGTANYLKNKNYNRMVAWVSACGVLLGLSVCAYKQVGYWQNSIKLNEHAIAVTSRNYVAHMNLGYAFEQRGRIDQAITHYTAAVKILPNDKKPLHRLTQALIKAGRASEVVSHYSQSMAGKAGDYETHLNLALAFELQDKPEQAIEQFQKALQYKPDQHDIRTKLGVTLGSQQRLEEAVAQFRQILQSKPDDARAHYFLGLSLKLQGKLDEAVHHLEQSVKLNPNDDRAELLLKDLMSQRNSSDTKQKGY